MKKSDVLMYAALVVIAGILVYSIAGLFANESAAGASIAAENKAVPSAGNAFEPVLTGTTGQGDVAIELVPKGIQEGKFIVQIEANTHSVNLGQFNLKEITTLEYNGKLLNPESAPALSSHHSSGTLVFGVGEEITSFTIKINGIPKIEERVFEWR